jgi:hypothetical protein
MKKMIFLAAMTIASVASAGYTKDMSCADAAGAVQAHGAIVLHERDGIYDRYVAHGGYCMVGETTKPAWIMTADTDQCFVGYTCVSQSNEGGGGN